LQTAFWPHSNEFLEQGGLPLEYILIAGLSLALLIAVVVLVHQVRLRRGLQVLLRRLLEKWRHRNHE
jgi:hypothetical protein